MTQNAAIELMEGFAGRTGLNSDVEPRRYLWTDAFAVINFLELHQRTRDERYKTLARELVAQVHWVLGRHRADDPRSGWLSGLQEETGADHPTAAGLRIGKPLPERGLQDPPDERLEWERDGQYFHYLTKWMDALARTGSLCRENLYHRQAAELAKSVFPLFLKRSTTGEPVGLHWKMSIDLSRPQVHGTSPHDALDGYATFRWLDALDQPAISLGKEIEVLGGLAEGHAWDTSDPLGLGGLLLDAFKLTFLPDRTKADARMIGNIVGGVARGLESFIKQDVLDQPAARRLGFRELGLAIGLQTTGPMASAAEDSSQLAEEAGQYIAALRSAAKAGTQITAFWSDDRNRQSATWQDHRDINDVMLATELLKAQVETAKI